MLSLLKRKPKLPAMIEQPAPEPVRRTRQQNIKVSDDCSAAFAALAEAQGISKAALFEDMVAERLETLQRHGVKLELA
ncbi:MAG: ribbon-helix-helix protein, CopG family [Rhodomicrobium sp.]